MGRRRSPMKTVLFGAPDNMTRRTFGQLERDKFAVSITALGPYSSRKLDYNVYLPSVEIFVSIRKNNKALIITMPS